MSPRHWRDKACHREPWGPCLDKPGPKTKASLDHACLLLSCSDRLTHQSNDMPPCIVITNPRVKSLESYSHAYWVAWFSTPKCIPHTK